MALGSCYTCIRYLMFAFNFLFWLLGCAILGVGIWVRVDENFGKYVNNSEHFNLLYTGAYIFIVVGIIIMVVGFLGCCGAIRENRCMLGTFFALLFVIFCILLGAGIWAVVAKDDVKEKVNKALEDGVAGYFDERSPEREFMDMVQNDFKCCGATKGILDYSQHVDKIIEVETCKHFTEPCNEKLFEFVKENLLIIAGVSIGIAVILILGMIFSMILCCALNDAQIMNSQGADQFEQMRRLVNTFVVRIQQNQIDFLASFYGTSATSEEPDQTTQNAASDQVLQYLLTEKIFSDLNEIETYYSTIL